MIARLVFSTRQLWRNEIDSLGVAQTFEQERTQYISERRRLMLKLLSANRKHAALRPVRKALH